MLHHVQHYANKAEPASLVGFLLFYLILFYFGANYAIMTLQELCKTCASVVGRVVVLFCFLLAPSGKILAQFLCKSCILFYFIANARTDLELRLR